MKLCKTKNSFPLPIKLLKNQDKRSNRYIANNQCLMQPNWLTCLLSYPKTRDSVAPSNCYSLIYSSLVAPNKTKYPVNSKSRYHLWQFCMSIMCTWCFCHFVKQASCLNDQFIRSRSRTFEVCYMQKQIFQKQKHVKILYFKLYFAIFQQKLILS